MEIESNPGEIWKAMPDEGADLFISSHGRIWRRPCVSERPMRGSIVKQPLPGKFLGGKRASPKGYMRVNFGSQPIHIHRLVAKYFVENPSEKPHVNHLDGNKRNNKADNLEWVTNAENRKHAVLNGLHASGERVSKLTGDQVDQIRLLAKNGVTQKEIAGRFSISQQNVSKIVRGKRWAHSRIFQP